LFLESSEKRGCIAFTVCASPPSLKKARARPNLLLFQQIHPDRFETSFGQVDIDQKSKAFSWRFKQLPKRHVHLESDSQTHHELHPP
jgi:hypothetical protein